SLIRKNHALTTPPRRLAATVGSTSRVPRRASQESEGRWQSSILERDCNAERICPARRQLRAAESGGCQRVWCRRSAEFLRESDEKPFRPADAAETICVLILDNFAHQLRAAPAEPVERRVDVVNGEHDA